MVAATALSTIQQFNFTAIRNLECIQDCGLRGGHARILAGSHCFNMSTGQGATATMPLGNATNLSGSEV